MVPRGAGGVGPSGGGESDTFFFFFGTALLSYLLFSEDTDMRRIPTCFIRYISYQFFFLLLLCLKRLEDYKNKIRNADSKAPSRKRRLMREASAVAMTTRGRPRDTTCANLNKRNNNKSYAHIYFYPERLAVV